MRFEEFSTINRERCESPNGFNHSLESWSTSDWLVAVLGELGEAANIVKKLNRVRDGIPGNKPTLIYCANVKILIWSPQLYVNSMQNPRR